MVSRVPNERESQIIESLIPLLEHALETHQDVKLTDVEQEAELPEIVTQYLVEILRCLEQGQAIQVVPANDELSTQQAADLLGVSRPYLVKLLDEGVLPSW